MSDFVQVMKGWQRMCDSMQGGIRKCDNCKLFKVLCQHKPNEKADFAEAEQIIEKWAAEHPVVYPTWGEWLISVGAARKIPTDIPFQLPDGRIVDSPWATVIDVNTPIPADIAQKLGIEPKEG